MLLYPEDEYRKPAPEPPPRERDPVASALIDIVLSLAGLGFLAAGEWAGVAAMLIATALHRAATCRR